jgi:hypothetical protein
VALEPIIFKGGTWDGEFTEVHKGDPPGRSAERTNRNGEGIDVYVRSSDTVEFTQMIKLRGGVLKPKVRKSTVFKFAGTKRFPWHTAVTS